MVIQPSPNRSASPIDRRPFAATTRYDHVVPSSAVVSAYDTAFAGRLVSGEKLTPSDDRSTRYPVSSLALSVHVTLIVDGPFSVAASATGVAGALVVAVAMFEYDVFAAPVNART